MATISPDVRLRTMPESVTLTREQYIELLATLEAVKDVFVVLNGRVESPANEVITGALCDLDALAGEIGEEDEACNRDPIWLASGARGHELSSKILQAMAEAPGHGLMGLAPANEWASYLAFSSKDTLRFCKREALNA